MNDTQCAACQEWLGLEADGRLPEELAAGLDRHLADCAECREERSALAALGGLLERSRVGVHRGFAARVMASLPAAGWEGSAPRSWRLPVALMALLAAASAALVGLSSAQLGPGMPFLGALTAVAGLFSASLLAGAGMLGASWQGLGMVVGELFATSTGNLVAFVVLVIAANVLLVALARRRRRPAEDRIASRDRR